MFSEAVVKRAIVLCFGLAVVAGDVRAEPRDPAAAEALFREGKKLLEAGETGPACEKLSDSHRLDPATGTLGLLALCHERQGKTATAWQEWLEVAAMARDANQAKREAAAKSRAADLESKLSRVTIDVQSPVDGIEVSRNGNPVVRSQWGVAIAVDPGTVQIRAAAEGYETWTTQVSVAADGDRQTVAVPALARAESAAKAKEPEAPRPLATSTDVEADSSSSEETIGYVLGGVGVVGVGIGTFFGFTALSKNGEADDHCDADNRCDQKGVDLRDDALGAATISTVGFGVGVVALGAGAYFLLTSGDDEADQVRLTPSAGPRGGAVRLSGSF